MNKNIYVLLVVIPLNLYSQNNPVNQNYWQIGFTFGEIPILSGSFKPGISVGYHFTENIMTEFIYQLKDYLQRDDESFNGFTG